MPYAVGSRVPARVARTSAASSCSRFSSVRGICATLLVALSLSGCSGLKTYPNALEKNALVHVQANRSGLLSSFGVALDLYSVDARCGSSYLGTLELDEATVQLGLPLEQKVLLAYVFSHDAILGTSGTAVIEMMVTPRRGERYEFNVAYLKEGYTATGQVFVPGNPQARDVEYARLQDCTPTAQSQ